MQPNVESDESDAIDAWNSKSLVVVDVREQSGGSTFIRGSSARAQGRAALGVSQAAPRAIPSSSGDETGLDLRDVAV